MLSSSGGPQIPGLIGLCLAVALLLTAVRARNAPGGVRLSTFLCLTLFLMAPVLVLAIAAGGSHAAYTLEPDRISFRKGVRGWEIPYDRILDVFEYGGGYYIRLEERDVKLDALDTTIAYTAEGEPRAKHVNVNWTRNDEACDFSQLADELVQRIGE